MIRGAHINNLLALNAPGASGVCPECGCDNLRKGKDKMDHTIVHFEIPADDVQALAQFYTELLGWKIETVKEFPDDWGIRTSEAEGALMGGMMKRKMPQQGPTNYVLVESVADYLLTFARKQGL
jgi:predicted enzyme related to lactoylglutathione lyase